MFSLRKGDRKAVFGNGSGGFSEPKRYAPGEGEAEGQLYNVADDIRETNNLWNSRQDVFEELRGILAKYQGAGRSR